MNPFKRVVLGCLILFGLAITIVITTAGVMVSFGPPEQHREVSTRNQDIDTPRWDSAAASTPGEVALPPVSLEVRVDLREGEFRILPGDPGEGIRMEADFDSGIYVLEHEHQWGVRETGVETVTIRFHSKYSMARRLLTLRGDFEVDNQIDIYLPPDVPMKVNGVIRMGESHLDLSGLPLTGLDLDLAMGAHEIQFDEPNPLAMEKLNIYASKGEFTARGLGNAGFQFATVRGSMGEVSLDLRGEYRHDASVRTNFRMGEFKITVPENIHVNVAPSRVMLGELSRSVEKGQNIPEDAPSLNLKSSMSMGELSIRSR